MTRPDRPSVPTERWNRIAALFCSALEVPAAARSAHLRSACPDDETLRQEVLEMLEAHEGGTPLLLEENRRLRPSDPALRASDLPGGTRIGPWRIERLVGQGGMGEVYRAEREDGAYRQTVAIKVLRPGYRTAETVRRFRVERQALARLVHPAIAAILDGGTLEDGRPYLVLQYVEGRPITRYCSEEGLSLADRLRLFVRVARVVEFAHSQLVIHRDLKPSNIFIEADGTPRLLDFGIARMLDPNLDASLLRPTRPESRLLTPEHAAPEQLRGEPCDTRTDVYGLGVLLFELLGGRMPFPSAHRTLSELERAILETEPPPVSSVVSDRVEQRLLRGDLDRIVQKALRKEPERRYGSAAQLADDLERHLDGLPVIAQPDRLGYRAAKFFRRNRALVAGGVGLAVLLLGFAITATIQARRLTTERDRAERERAVATDMLQILTGLFERANPRKVPGGDTVRVAVLLDEAEQRIEQLNDAPERQAALRRTVGELHLARGQYARAEELLRRSAEQQWALRGPDDLEAARTYHELATVVHYFHGGQLSRPMFDTSLARFRRLTPGGADLRVALTDLAGVTTDRQEQQALFREIVALERRDPGVDSMEIAGRLHTQATDLFGQGRAAEAVGLFQQALEIVSAKLPPDDPIRLTVGNNLAAAFSNTGAFAAAESLQRAALATVERLHAAADEQANAREHLALTLANLGQLEEAEALERAAIDYYRKGLAAEHPLIPSAIRNLALIVAALGRDREGLALLDSAITLVRAGKDPEAQAAAYMTGQKVPIFLRMGRTGEAAAAARLADSVIHLEFPEGSSRANDADRWAAMVAFAERQHETAIRRAGAALEGYSAGGTLSGPWVGQMGCLLGAALSGAGRLAESRTELERGCPQMEGWGMADPLIRAWGRRALQGGAGR